MKKILLTLTVLSLHSLQAQTEFTTFKNGLIYSEDTMSKLGKIVDSLHLKYKVCDLDQKFYSKQQTKGHLITLEKEHVENAKKDIDNHISYEDFIVKYPNAVVRKDLLIIKSKIKNYRDKDVITYNEIDFGVDYGVEIEKDYSQKLFEHNGENSWIYEYNDKDNYTDEKITAFYFASEFKKVLLEPEYSRQIIYSDCLIDTSSTKFIELNQDNEDKDLNHDFSVNLPLNWRKLSHSKKTEILEQMRSEKAVGSCSQDTRPRVQGVNMALLSAETGRWDIFLKSHLDIMNDRFDRLSDGSYAWKSRQTYIKELEELNINVYDLIMGITFRLDNPVKNHYYGSVGRLGRAVSEAKDREKFMSQMLAMIEDEKLDDYNRVISYFLFMSCNNYINDKNLQKLNSDKLKISVAKLPVYIYEKIKNDKA